jgi:hypothetical protein
MLIKRYDKKSYPNTNITHTEAHPASLARQKRTSAAFPQGLACLAKLHSEGQSQPSVQPTNHMVVASGEPGWPWCRQPITPNEHD